MKYLLVALVVMIGIGIWRNNRRKADTGERSASPRARRQAEHMVRCAHCGLHLPASDAIPGPDGQPFCSSEHRRLGAH